MTRRAQSTAVVALVAAVALAFVGLAGRAAAASPSGEVHGLPLPHGAKSIPGEKDRFSSPLGFRDTVEWYRKTLAARGIQVDFGPALRSRDVAYVRILPKDRAAAFGFVHIFLADGKTSIYISAPEITRGSSNGRTTDSDSVYLGSNPSPRTSL